jgi:hypothetical protein
MFSQAPRRASKIQRGIFAPLAIVSILLLAIGGVGWTAAQLKARLAEAADPAVWLDGSMLANAADHRLLGLRGAPQPRVGRYVLGGNVQRPMVRAPVHTCRWPATSGGV